MISCCCSPSDKERESTCVCVCVWVKWVKLAKTEIGDLWFLYDFNVICINYASVASVCGRRVHRCCQGCPPKQRKWWRRWHQCKSESEREGDAAIHSTQTTQITHSLTYSFTPNSTPCPDWAAIWVAHSLSTPSRTSPSHSTKGCGRLSDDWQTNERTLTDASRSAIRDPFPIPIRFAPIRIRSLVVVGMGIVLWGSRRVVQ